MSYKIGQISEFPKEVVNKMLDYQKEQGNKRDVKIFQLNAQANGQQGGFDWDLTPEGETTWSSIINNHNFDLLDNKIPLLQNVKYEGDIKDFPVEIVQKMLERQVEQGNKRNIKSFEEDRVRDVKYGNFTWSKTPEGLYFWKDVIEYKDFETFFNKYPKQTPKIESLSPPPVKVLTDFYRMNREGVFSPSKATDNQCGVKGVKHYQYNLTLLLKSDLDEQGFTIDHDKVNLAISKTKIFGSCEEMQKIICAAVEKVLPNGELIGYKCSIRPLDINAKAFIEYIKCDNPHYLPLL